MTLKQNTGNGPQWVYDEIHSMLMTAKISHYNTMSFSAHQALGRTYDSLDDLVDSITEKLIGYTGTRPTALKLDTVTETQPENLAQLLIQLGERIIEYASRNKFQDIENLGQELSGVGAQLKYLSSLK